MTRYYLGDWDGAAVDATAARALAQAMSQAWSEPLALAVSAEVPASRGQFEVAAEYLARAKAAMTIRSAVNIADTVLNHEVALAVARDDHEAVLDLLDPIWSDEYLHRVAPTRTFRPIMQARIGACIGLDRLAEAEQDLSRYEAMVGRISKGPIPSRLGWLRGLLAEARGRPPSLPAALRRGPRRPPDTRGPLRVGAAPPHLRKARARPRQPPGGS